MHSPEELAEIIREKGQRVTPQRRHIFKLLADDHSHPNVEDIYQRLQTQMPDVSRSTVYNTLHELVLLGELQEVNDLNEGSTRYDTQTQPHHHLYCERCHKIIDIVQDRNASTLQPGETSGFKINRSQATFYGLCPDCQE